MKEGKRGTEEAEAGLKSALRYHSQAIEWIKVVCCGGRMSGSHDEIWAPKEPEPCLSFFAYVLTAHSASFCSQG